MSQSNSPSASQFPLHELLAFEAAARHGSFQKAADELNVTQSAVSHRVINLERRLGVSLFHRKGRGIALTDEGEAYLEGVSAALTSLWAAGEELRAIEHSQIRVNFAPSIGNVWVLPHLPEFLRGNPNVRIDVASIATPEDASRAEWDVLVHYGASPSDDERRVPLLTDEVLVVGTPAILSNDSEVLGVEDVARLTVLRHTLLGWADWSAGAFGKKCEPARYMYFDDSITMLESAVSGAGIAITTRIAATPYLETGALVQIHPFVLKDNEYYVELSESGELKPAAKSFADWIVRLAASSRRTGD